ncbi:hypothetical protein V6N13_083740 [Hibiscus sabdariffa]|uniref:CCHC-type domain-containing protein n=1 Tax=Hibiscus sabdariffa TaxID=183260 RepID=A0ABR2SZI5_9ROSI
MSGDSDNYLDQCYHKNTYMKAYAYTLHPINGAHDWIKSGIESVQPPIEKKMSGRPIKNRRKAKDEPKKKKPGQLSRIFLIMKCRICRVEGHNKRRCPQQGNNNSSDPNRKSTSTTSVMSNTLSSNAHKEKQKQNTVDEIDQTCYFDLRSKAFNSHQMSIDGSSVQRKSPNKKRKFIVDLINTQESSAQKELKK